jgi:hypothetical protein
MLFDFNEDKLVCKLKLLMKINDIGKSNDKAK